MLSAQQVHSLLADAPSCLNREPAQCFKRDCGRGILQLSRHRSAVYIHTASELGVVTKLVILLKEANLPLDLFISNVGRDLERLLGKFL
jgi:hypothetical protein